MPTIVKSQLLVFHNRGFGPVNRSVIYGKAGFGYLPKDKLGRLR